MSKRKIRQQHYLCMKNQNQQLVKSFEVYVQTSCFKANGEVKRLLVTSEKPGAGKSTVVSM